MRVPKEWKNANKRVKKTDLGIEVEMIPRTTTQYTCPHCGVVSRYIGGALASRAILRFRCEDCGGPIEISKRYEMRP